MDVGDSGRFSFPSVLHVGLKRRMQAVSKQACTCQVPSCSSFLLQVFKGRMEGYACFLGVVLLSGWCPEEPLHEGYCPFFSWLELFLAGAVGLMLMPSMEIPCGKHLGWTCNERVPTQSTHRTGTACTNSQSAIRVNVDALRFLAWFVFRGFCSLSPFRL